MDEKTIDIVEQRLDKYRHLDIGYMTSLHNRRRQIAEDIIKIAQTELTSSTSADTVTLKKEPRWLPDFLEYCEIMKIPPTERDQIIFTAGMTFQAINQRARDER